MQNSVQALREVPEQAPYQAGDTLALFGELFQRGYANGLVEAAEKKGMKIIRSTVGRREKDHSLRPLNNEESSIVPQPFINIPLEAGFDFEPSSTGTLPVDLVKDIKLTDWDQTQLDFSVIESAQKNAIQRFQKNTKAWADEVQKNIEPGKNLMIAHLMAGGVPRAKIFMPLLNRVFKGRGERYIESEHFWKTDLGKFCALNFLEVTAETLRHLIEQTTELKKFVESKGGKVSYVAYGYHGTEVLIQDKYEWQSFAPYLQGWAKIELENIAEFFFNQGVSVSVYNAPEILTNSSSIFQGVEIPLYALMKSLKNKSLVKSQKIIQQCQALLKDEFKIEDVLKATDNFLNDTYIRKQYDFAKWPAHNRAQQLEKTLDCSDSIISMHKNEKEQITPILSEVIFDSCGYIMLNEGYQPKKPVWWIGHDVVAKTFEKISS